MVAEANVAELHRLVGLLLGHCDGARTLDGVGYNAYDSPKAQELWQAGPERWQPGDAGRAWRMLRKYRKQLAKSGVDFDSVPEPEEEEAVAGVISVLGDGRFVATFRYSADVVAAVKQVPGARFQGRDQGGPRWIWPATPEAKAGIRWLERTHGFALAPAARQLVEAPSGPLLDLYERESSPERLQVARPMMPQSAPTGTAPKVDADETAWLVHNTRGNRWFSEALDAVKALDWNLRRWQAETYCWRVRVSEPSALVINRLVSEFGFELTEAAKAHLDEVGGLAGELDEVIAALPDDMPGLDDIVSRSGMTLREFQKAGVARALHWRRSINAFQVGLGKTVVALATARVANAFPLVVLCQASKKLDWAAEADEWIPGKWVHVVQRRADPIPLQAEIVVCNYDVLADTKIDNGPDEEPTYLADGVWRKLAALMPAMVAVDESQLIKNERAGRTRAALQLIESADIRLLLSGTAVKSRAGELIPQLQALGVIDKFGGVKGYKARYAQIEVINVGGKSIEREVPTSMRAIELHKRLTAWCYFRKTKKEVMPELPPVTRHVVPLRLTNQEEYDRARDEFLDWVYQTSLSDAEFAAQLPKTLTEEEREEAIKDHASEKTARARRAQQISKINALKRVAAYGIMPGVVRWVERKIEADGKLIVFAHHKDVQKTLFESFPGAARLHADDDEETQQVHKARFQKDPDCPLIVVSMGVGATGHTLTAAYACAFVELGWTPSDHDQAEGRAYGRVNDPHGLDSYWFAAEGTIYEWVMELLDKKRLVVDAILDGIAPEGSDDILGELMSRLQQAARASHGGTERRIQPMRTFDAPPAPRQVAQIAMEFGG